ncbi:MAG TPA: cupin domain-containing protein [Solirubrobacteraceae bacterium]|nr:cupin domain-containing protein [Solirubrobacteraceae bacterium]
MTDINPLDHAPASAVTPVTAAMPLRISHDDLPGPPDARRFIGAHHGGLPISLFLLDDPPGAGPLLHRHLYAEVFVVHAGEARFEIDGSRLTATGGDILIAPAMSAHRFTNTGEAQLRITAIHTAPEMETEWLKPTTGSRGTAC